MHHRRPHSVGADAHIGPLGIDIKSAIAERTPRRGAHRASGTGCDIHRAWSMHPVLGGYIIRPSVSKKSFRHAVRIFKLLKKFKNTCRLNAKGAFCPLHTSPAALSQTSSARFFDSLWGGYIIRPYRWTRGRAAVFRCRGGYLHVCRCDGEGRLYVAVEAADRDLAGADDFSGAVGEADDQAAFVVKCPRHGPAARRRPGESGRPGPG